jgi:uncharacterized protein
MKQINSSADFQQMLEAESAIVFIAFQPSAQTGDFGRDWPQAFQLFQQPDGAQNEVYLLKPDTYPFTWKWVNRAIETLGESETPSNCAFQLKKGELIGGISETGRSFNQPDQRNAFDTGLLKILCCPETHQELKLAPPLVLDKLNAEIAARHLQNRKGHFLRDNIDAGLIRADGRYLYPIRENIPVLLVDEAVPLTGEIPMEGL